MTKIEALLITTNRLNLLVPEDGQDAATALLIQCWMYLDDLTGPGGTETLQLDTAVVVTHTLLKHHIPERVRTEAARTARRVLTEAERTARRVLTEAERTLNKKI